MTHPTQSPLFPAGDDLPLFSGTPVRVDDNLFLPAPEACRRITQLIDDLDGDPEDPRQLTLDEANALLTEIYSICDTAGEQPALAYDQTIMQTSAPAGPVLTAAMGRVVVYPTGAQRCANCGALLDWPAESCSVFPGTILLCASCFAHLAEHDQAEGDPQ